MPDKPDEMVVTDHDVDDCAVSQAAYGEDPRKLDETHPRWLCILQTHIGDTPPNSLTHRIVDSE